MPENSAVALAFLGIGLPHSAWRQLAVPLAGVGLVIPVDPKWYFLVGLVMMVLFVYKYLTHRRGDAVT